MHALCCVYRCRFALLRRCSEYGSNKKGDTGWPVASGNFFSSITGAFLVCTEFFIEIGSVWHFHWSDAFRNSFCLWNKPAFSSKYSLNSEPFVVFCATRSAAKCVQSDCNLIFLWRVGLSGCETYGAIWFRRIEMVRVPPVDFPVRLWLRQWAYWRCKYWY